MTIGAVAAHDLNDELTVILSGAALALRCVGQNDPARAFLLELQAAAQRCAWKVSGLLNFSAKGGAQASAHTMERMIEASR